MVIIIIAIMITAVVAAAERGVRAGWKSSVGMIEEGSGGGGEA